MQFISLTVLIRRIKSIKSFLKDPKVPKRRKLLVIFGIIYLLIADRSDSCAGFAVRTGRRCGALAVYPDAPERRTGQILER